jgi:glyoxylase-like metal-dependent hydrolase (beta-lactamase superfamily II)
MFKIGSSIIEKVHEMDLNAMSLQQLMPAFDSALFARHPDWLPAGTTDTAGHAFLSFHVWLVRHNGRTILIDTAAGNDKERPQQAALNRLQNPFLARLAVAGIEPEDVDFILHTHIHSDHVGWNTRLADGRWVPTFPRAEIICSDLEWRYGAALTDRDEVAIRDCRLEAGLGEPVRIPVSGTFADSLKPLDGKVPIRRIPIDGAEILPGIRFLPTPGHSICHASIEIVSDGEVALFSGDVFHHPAEIHAPDLISVFCEFPEAARRSRKLFMDHAIATGATVFSSHFPLSSAGRICRDGEGYAWTFNAPLPA